MKHLSDGTLRRLIDEPFAIADSQKSHLAACATCEARYTRIAADARAAFLALELPEHAPNAVAGLAAVRGRLGATAPSGVGGARKVWGRSLVTRALGTAVAAGAVLGAVTLTPAGSMAQSFVTIFQPSQVQAVQLSSLDLRSLAQLRHYGTIHRPGRLASRQVSSPADASRLSGMTVLSPSSVPSGVPSAVSYAVSPGGTASFTFNGSRARAWAARAGKVLPDMPAGIDGSTINVTVGTAVVTTYGGCTTGCSDLPQLVIGQMVAPRITSTGANLKQLEDYVFSLPGVPAQLATELRSIGAPTATLPIPVPSALAHADPVTVQGVSGEAIGDNTGIGSLVVWEKNGVVYAVGGTMPLSQVESIADSLH